MTRPLRPAPVTRFLHRPLWWALAVAALALVQFAAHAREVRADAATFAETYAVTADTSPVDPATGVIDLTYREPRSGEVIRAAVFARSFVSRSDDGHLTVDVSRSDPSAVRLQGEARDYFDEMPFLLVLLVVPLVAWALRRLHVRRMDRLIAADDISFAMLGAVQAPARLHPRWRLCLYPVDARPGALPVCAVELVWLPLLPGGAFPVEVKGDPRPFGSIAVRSGDRLLYPRGRCLAARVTHGLPAITEDFPSVAPRAYVFPPPARPSLGPARLLCAAGVAALAAYLWVGGGTSWRDEQALERSRPAVATVIRGTDAPSSTSTVSYDRDGTPTTAELLVQSTGPPPGSTLAIRYDIDDPGVVWQAGERGPPDPNGDVVLMLTVMASAGLLVAAVLVRRRVLAEIGAYELATEGQVDVGTLPAPPR